MHAVSRVPAHAAALLCAGTRVRWEGLWISSCVCTPAAQRARVHDLPDDHPRGGNADTDVQGTPDLLPQSPVPPDMPAMAPAARVPATRLSD